ncbi:autotransporter outer membrane beta-barrel domain-containing protein [Parvularcula mediterranea]|uniref:hypothetical protein n=1 Tax=Parvularcula mediterranea TaxID=2732508 RepID=UPI001E363F04|nr:hypothetical protein [Parvularcula mediterranea]
MGLRGTQELSGSGRVLLSGENAVGGVARNVLQLTSTSNAREELTIGSDIVVEGWGSVSANGNDDTIRFEGLAKGSSEGPLTLFDIDNTQGDGSAGALRVDSSEGVVAVGQSARIIGADFVGEAGTDGILEFFASAVLEEVSLSMDSLLDGTTQSRTVFVQEGLALDGSLEIRGTQSRTTEFRFQGEQEISGTGEIVLTDGGVGDADPLSYLAIQGVTGASEILTIGEDITVRGEGWIFSRSTNDLFAIDGRVVAEGGRLRIEDTASVNGEVGALAGGLLEMRQADLLTEQSKLVIGLDGAGDDAAAGLVTIRQAITLEGILKLEVGDGFAAELGDSFVIAREDFNVTNGEAFAGAFDGFEGFDLEGDLAFRLVRSTDPENSSIQTLVLEVVEDATAEAGGFIGAGSVFTPPDLPAEGTRVEITLDEIGGRVADSEITGTTTDGLSRVEVTNTLAVLENVALGVDLGVDAANGTRRVDIEQGLTFANGAQIILEDSENGVAEARFFGTQTVDGEGGIFMSRVNANVLGIESEIEFVNTLSGARELLTFGEDVTISGDGRVFANGFEDRIRILGEVVGTPENLLEIEDLDNGGATLMVDASAGRVAVDDVVENTRFEGTGELELFDGSYRNVSFGMDARFGGVASGGQTLTVEEGLEVDSLLTVEAPTGGTRFLTALGEQSLVGTGEIVLSGDETSEGQAQNYLDFNGTLVRAETLVIGPDLTVRGEGHIRAIDADDLVDIQGTLIVEGLFEVEDLADFGGTLEIARTGTLEVEDRFNELRELTLTGDAQVTIALGGSGLDARAGQIVIFGEAALAGTLTLDVEAGFTGEIGDEFVIASARDGFASVFDAIEGFDIDGDDKALALVQDDTTLSVRIVSQDEAGSFFLRSQLPPDPVLPELSGTFTGVIDDALAGGPLAQVDDSGATFNSVDLQTDVLIQTDDDGFFRQGFLQVSDGLTLTGADITLESTPSDRAYLLFNGPQTVSGTGEIVLSETNGTPFRPVTNWVGFSGSDFNAPETLTFDVVVRGAGSIFTNSAQDRFQFLDEVIAEGGRLTISYINNGGETLVVSEQLGGELIIQSAIEDTVLSPTAGTVVEIASATIRDLEVAGEGAVDIRSSSAEGILVTGNAILTNGRDLTVEGLVVDGEFVVAGSNSTSVLGLRGTQELSGSGRVLLSGENAVGGVARNVLQLTSTSNAREELTIGSDIVVEGWGSVSANGNDDTIRFEGLAKGSSEGPLTLFDIDNTQGDGSAGALRVDSSEGVVAVGQSARIIGADFVGEAGTDGILEFFASAVLEEVSLSMDSLLDGTTQSRTVFVQEGLALDGSLEIRGTQSRTTEFRFQGEQEISGTGEIVLTDGGVGDADPLSYLAIQGVTGASEILTIGEDITVRGEGWIFSRSTNDLFAIDGRVVAEGGRLRIEDTASVNGEVGALAGGLLEMRQADLLTEQSKLVIGLDGAGDDAAAGLVTIRQAITLEGILKLEVGDGFAAELGDSFVIAREDFNVTNGEAFAGAFDGFEGFDLEGDLAFRLVRSTDPENSSIQTLVLEVVEDATAEAGGFIGAGSVFTPPDLPAEGTRVEITLDEIGGRVADSEITGTTTDGLSRVEVTNTLAVLENVALGVDLGVDAANGTRRVDIEQGLTFANGAQIILEDSENGVAEARFFGTQTVDGEGGIFMSRVNANVLGIESEIEFVNTLSGARELLTFGEDVTISGDGRVFANGFEDRIRILGEVVGTPENLLEIEDLDNGGATLMVDASAGRVAVDDVVENTRFEGTGELELFDGSYRNVSFGMDARFGGVASGGQTLTVEEGLEVDSLLTVEAPTGGTRFLTALGEQSLVGTGEIVLSGDETSEGQAQNYLDFNGTLVRAETLVIGPDLTVRGEGHIRAIDADDLVDIQGTLIVEGLFEVEDLADFGGTLEIARTGTLEVEDRFNELRELTLTGDAQVTIALGGSGLDARAGQIVIFGEAALAGTLTLDVEAGFTGEIGDEFVIASARDGFASVFDAIEGFDIDGDDKALALVQDDTTLSVRIVSQDEANTIIQREDLPADPVLPEVNGTITGVLNEAAAGGPLVRVDDSTATFDDVTLEVDVNVTAAEDSFFRSAFLQVTNGLTINDQTISAVPGEGDRSWVYFIGEQTVDGTGTIVLNDRPDTPFITESALLEFDGQDFGTAQTLTLAAGIDIRGSGDVFTDEAEDRFDIAGDVTAVGGRLDLSNVDNDGGMLNLFEDVGGQLVLGGTIDNTVLNPASGVEVDVQATLNDVTVAGAGSVDFQTGAVHTNLSIDGKATIGQGRDLNVVGLDLDGLLTISGSNSVSALNLRGEQTFTGTGRVLMTTDGAVNGTALNYIQLVSLSGDAEVLTIDSGLTIEGPGLVFANSTGDSIVFDALAKGAAGGVLKLGNIDNTDGGGDRGILRVDASAGEVGAAESRFLRGVDVTSEAGAPGVFSLFSGANLDFVAFTMDAELDAREVSKTVFIQNGLDVASTLTVTGTNIRTGELRFQGEQELGGGGEIILVDGGVSVNQPATYLTIQGLTADAEVLTLAEGTTVRGVGWLFSRSTNDLFAFDGRVVADGGLLRVEDTTSVDGEVGALAGSTLEIRQGNLLTEQSKLVVGLEGAGDDAEAGLVTITQVLTLEGILKLEVGDGFSAELGDTFVIARENTNITNGEAFVGSFDGYEGFDLEGDLAFRLVQSTDPENSSIETLVLEVVNDAAAEAEGFIGDDAAFIPPATSGIESSSVPSGDAGKAVSSFAVIDDVQDAMETGPLFEKPLPQFNTGDPTEPPATEALADLVRENDAFLHDDIAIEAAEQALVQQLQFLEDQHGF